MACMALRSRDTDVTDPWRSGGRILENDVDTLCCGPPTLARLCAQARTAGTLWAERCALSGRECMA